MKRFFWARQRASSAVNGFQYRPIVYFQPAMRTSRREDKSRACSRVAIHRGIGLQGRGILRQAAPVGIGAQIG